MFRRSFREPDAWSAAVRKNFSVFVAAGSTGGTGSSGGFSGAAGAGSADPDACGLEIYEFSTPRGTVLLYGGGDIIDGATVVGWLKNVPSSNDSRKSLRG